MYRYYLLIEWFLKFCIFTQQYLEQKLRNEEAGELTELVRDFLEPAVFFNQLKVKGIDFFCGVPDSLLKGKLIDCWCFVL